MIVGEQNSDVLHGSPNTPSRDSDVVGSDSGEHQNRAKSSNLRWWLTGFLILVAIGIVGTDALNTTQGRFFIAERFQTFVTIFLGIFIEAAPFLLAGSLVSGFIAVFVDQEMLDQYLPKQPILAAFAGSLLGLVFPVCECGVVPVTRRLYEKGLPLSIGIAFLLSAPVINPVVIISTYAAFGWGAVVYGRVIFTILIAFMIGVIFQFANGKDVLLPKVLRRHNRSLARKNGRDFTDDDSFVDSQVPKLEHLHNAPNDHNHNLANGETHARGYIPEQELSTGQRIATALHTSGDDFIDMGRYLIIGSMLAATMQTLVPQSALLSVGQGSILSVLVMQALAFVLSVCSTVDAFLALAFAGTFTTGSIIAFLTFGPMVDIKSALMFLGVFQRRIVFYLIAVPFVMSLLIGIAWNIFIG